MERDDGAAYRASRELRCAVEHILGVLTDLTALGRNGPVEFAQTAMPA